MGYTWKVLSYDDRDSDEGTVLWREAGTIESDYSFGPDADDIGSKFGVGQFLLLRIESDGGGYGSAVENEIVSEPRYSYREKEAVADPGF